MPNLEKLNGKWGKTGNSILGNSNKTTDRGTANNAYLKCQ